MANATITKLAGNVAETAAKLDRIAAADPKGFGRLVNDVLPALERFKRENGRTMRYDELNAALPHIAPSTRDGKQFDNPARVFLARIAGKYGKGENQYQQPAIVQAARRIRVALDAASGVARRNVADEIRNIPVESLNVEALDV